MTSDLRTRIAKALQRRNEPLAQEWEDKPAIIQDEYLMDADAVIAELGEQECPMCSHVYRLEDHQ